MARQTRTVRIGGNYHIHEVPIGGTHPVVIQTMWKEKLDFPDSGIIGRLENLERMGAKLIRFAVPSIEAAETLGELAKAVPIPLVADIHFDYKIALRVLDFPIAKLRLNPGNISIKNRVFKVLEKAGKQGVPVRIGINAGSLPADLRARVETGELRRAEALVNAAERELAFFDEARFKDVVVSMKASSVPETIEANRIFAGRNDAPLHIGVTEAGPLTAGLVRSAAALYPLLCEGIGDTVRVSLSDSAENEVIAAREILGCADETAGYQNALQKDGVHAENRCKGARGVRLVSCPRCGRCGFDTHAFTARWQERLYALQKNITIAVMGCVVNGPGEAREADLGITGAGEKALIFKRGKIARAVDVKDADSAFEEELRGL
ncbi:MAG: (E)-4-hydroxy-3-methylbut-2-enyl-diphosphate synthase [Spirochaetaceae bacterium]|nr:(E)-4-hydroxy-3-methylbut-2-enyl-diphosphate synthase [Spirochaetaceae bacterium]